MFFFFFLPFKKYQFHKSPLKSSSVCYVLSQFVSVYMSRNICIPQQVRKAMCEISLFLCPLLPNPSFVEHSGVLNPVISSVRGSVSAKEGTDCCSLATVWTHTFCGRVNIEWCASQFLYCFFFYYSFFSCNNSLFVVFSDKVSVNSEMTWRAHCLVFFCAIKWNQQDNSRTQRDKASYPLAE